MSVPILFFIFALLLALVEQFRAGGKSLTTWAVIAVSLGLLWGQYA